MNNIAANKIDSDVDQTLNVLLSPGNCTRFSPLIESSQLFLLTGEWIDEQERYGSIQSILNKNHLFIKQLAMKWNETRNNFCTENYEDKTYLQMYALYYFSVNICKLQVIFHEMALQGQLGKRINLLDIGVGAGSTAVALLDFLYSWGLANELHHKPFFVEEFNILGLDKSKQALDISANMVNAYQQAIQRRINSQLGEMFNEPSAKNDYLQKVINWTKNIKWKEFDLINSYTNINEGTNLVVLSNIWSEFSQEAKENIETLLLNLPDETKIVLLEPGDKNKTTELMRWRADFLNRNSTFYSLAPCGNNNHNPEVDICSNCWASRRESFHQTLLYRAFRNECIKEVVDSRSFDEYQNNLLSWSYVVLKKDNSQSKKHIQNIKYSLPPNGPITGLQYLHALGKFYNKGEQKLSQLVDYPIDQNHSKNEDRKWNEYIRVCPLSFSDAKSVVFERTQGFQIPPYHFGEEIQATNLNIKYFVNSRYKLFPQIDGLTNISSSIYKSAQGKGRFLQKYDERTRQIIDDLAFRLFGFPKMRDFQHNILSRVLCGKSILGIAATGGGKSECYILPAMILPGITVVVSPLLSLMTDQYDQRICKRYGLGDLTTYINGDVPFKERQARLKRMEMGYYKLVYFTPEQLEKGYILDCLRRANISVGIRYLALDECHCISQWGHDFRPSYLNIVHRLKEYKISPVVIALTATASPQVRDDVCNELGLNPLPVDQGGDVFVYSSNRPEINLEVRVKNTTEDKVNDILKEIHKFYKNNQQNQHRGAAIIFMPHTGGSPEKTKRKPTEQIYIQKEKNSSGVTEFASYLERAFNKRIAIYHAKMEIDNETQKETHNISSTSMKGFGDLSGRTRIQEQNNFINSTQTGVDVMIATKGFGMGIDKPNIRLVIHRTPPSNLEAYAQEFGRAGRDGKMATAILYYSSDSNIYRRDLANREINEPICNKSDYQIQEDFLNNRYIRREDVIVMHTFLKQVKHQLSIEGKKGQSNRKYLYFTCDEAIDFFDNYIAAAYPSEPSVYFAWPEFPNREPYSYESPEHKVILDRGFLYNNKKLYIDRILAALFGTRPENNNHEKMVLLENVQETGAQVKGGKVNDWNHIFHSNSYFGELFREKNITEEEFTQALKGETLLNFAQRLNLALKEVSSLLYDIKLSEGNLHSDRWNGTLLEFNGIFAPLWGPAEGKDDIESWRDYAGACKRSKKPFVNMDNNHHNTMTTNDYFPWGYLNKSKGWEVLLGSAFDEEFPEFLDTFIQLHRKRKQQGQESYKRFLTDYIGIEENGSVKSNNKPKECLRSVLLGYLESYEVVVDGKCYSCSNCVPDKNYEQYSKELREKAVIRMAPTLVASFKDLKKYKDDIPDEKISNFFELLFHEEEKGLSVYRYFIGWSGKILDENPDHLTAKWLRIEGMMRKIIPIRYQEFLSYSDHLTQFLSESCLIRLFDYLESHDTAFQQDVSYYKLCSQISKKLKKHHHEAEYLEKMIPLAEQLTQDTNDLFDCTSRLVYLYSPSGPIYDQNKYQEWCLFTARHSRSYAEGIKGYGKITANYNWEDIEREFIELINAGQNSDIQAALFVSWISTDLSHRAQNFISWLKKTPDVVSSWPKSAQEVIFPFLPDELILESNVLLEAYVDIEQNENNILRLSLKYLVLNSSLNPKVIRRITKLIALQGKNASLVLKRYIDAEYVTHMKSQLLPFVNMENIDELLFWQTEFLNSEDNQTITTYFKSLINALVKVPGQFSRILDHQKLILEYAAHYSEIEFYFIQFLSPIYLHHADLLNGLLEELSNMGDWGEDTSNKLLDSLLDEGMIDQLRAIKCSTLSERWESDIFLVHHLYLYITKIVKKTDFNSRYYHISDLANLFNWKNDLIQADMLSSILMELYLRIHPTNTEILQILTEVLVHSGRSSLAVMLNKTKFNILLGERKMTIKEYISTYNILERTDEFSSDFKKIARNILSEI